MPVYRSIRIALHSQFDIETLPEYYPPPLASLIGTQRTCYSDIPPFVDEKTSTCSVHVPVFPGGQFWIAYSVAPPVPENQHFLFKLYIDGEKVMSWSTDKEYRWMGKTMYGLFESNEGDCARRRIEKRVLCFSATGKDGDTQDGCVEIKVHRASGRKRIEREFQVFEETAFAKSVQGVSLANAGRAGPESPKRFYKFALIDPIDQPFATFRYFYHTWDQLHDLGLLDHESCADSEENDLSVIEPGTDAAEQNVDTEVAQLDNSAQEQLENVCEVDSDADSTHDCNADVAQEMSTGLEQSAVVAKGATINGQWPSRKDSLAASTYIPSGAPDAKADTLRQSPELPRHSDSSSTSRLSMPPSQVFEAPEPPRAPPIPQKYEQLLSSTAYRPHPAYPIEEWAVRTPSPMQSIREEILTPPMEKKKYRGVTGVGLLGMLPSSWKRSFSSMQAPEPNKTEKENRSASC